MKKIIIFSFILLFICTGCTSKMHKVNTDNKKKTLKDKLSELDNINEQLDFFKSDYIDRYIKYKNSNSSLSLEEVIVHVNIGLDNDFYTNLKSSTNLNTAYMIVNKYNNLDKDYIPIDLESINSNYSIGDKKLIHIAKVAFEELASSAKMEGFIIKAMSTYRSYYTQNYLYSNYVNTDGKKIADKYSARPGFSEHQTGLAVDVQNNTTTYTNFGSTKEFTWMKENAYKYGFIMRYTEEYQSITGYMNEPWHYRYVGVNIATYIYNNPMTYEEYYVRFIEKK